MMQGKKYSHWVVLLIFALPMFGCMKDPVTGESTFSLLSESQEIALGAQSHDSVLDSYGLYADDTWQNYVSGIGMEIGKVSHRSHLEYHFYVADSPAVNAFALPGGWVYFTRGILAHFNSEDELAGVMGHEIGHVVARHGAEQYSRNALTGLGLEVASGVSETFAGYRQIAELGAGLLLLKFSRSQESESDKLGVDYATRLGYDGHEMAGFFRTIGRISEGGQSLPNFLSTHPNPANREKRVHELTEQYRAEHGYTPRRTSSDAYLRRLEGMVYGEDPRQGFVNDDKSWFYHPNDGFQFPIPSGWQFQRARTVYQMVHPQQKGVIQLRKEKEGQSIDAAADKFIQELSVNVTRRKQISLKGYRAIQLESTLTQGEQKVGIMSFFIANRNNLFTAHGYCAETDYSGLRGTFSETLSGFGQLTNRAARSKKPERVRIKSAPYDGTLERNLKALGMGSERMPELAILNGLETSDSIKKGKLLKTVGR